MNSKNVIGAVVVAVGLVMLLNNLAVIDYPVSNIFRLWPIILIYIGMKNLSRRLTFLEFASGVLLLTVGSLLLVRNTGIWDVDLTPFWQLFWPLVVIFFGISFFAGKRTRGSSNLAILGGLDRTKGTWELESGNYLAFWGGIELDLGLAHFKEPEVLLDLTAIMGGIDIKVPENIDVECSGTSILGGMDLLDQDSGGIIGSGKASQKADPFTNNSNPNRVIIQGRALMGGISVHRKKYKRGGDGRPL